MKEAGVDHQKIASCVGQKSEEYLSEELQNVAWSPQALRLNGWRYSGPLDPETVLKAICSGYVRQPEECTNFMEGGEVPFIHKTVGLSVSGAISAFSGLILTLGVIFYFYKRYVTKSVRSALREEVMLEVQSQMADYAPLHESSGGVASGNKPLSF